MSTDLFKDHFPDYKTRLIVLPGPPRELSDHAVLSAALGNGSLIEILQQENATGFLLRSEQTLTGTDDEVDSSENSAPEHINHVGAPIFIPSSGSNSIIIFKNVSRLLENGSDKIGTSIIKQIQALEHLFSSGLPPEGKPDISIHVVLMIDKQTKPDKAKEADSLFEAMRTSLEVKTNSITSMKVDLLRITTSGKCSKIMNPSNCHEKESLKLWRQILKGSVQPANYTSHECLLRLVMHNSEEKLQLNGSTFKVANSVFCQLRERESVLKICDNYFPNVKKGLVIVPNFDQTTRNLLYSTREDSGTIAHDQDRGYLGEIFNFPKQLLSKIQNPRGVLLRNMGSEHVNSLLQKTKTFNVHFEVDWLFCGKRYLVVFEVGSAKSGNPTSALRNKIEQTITKIIPKFKLLLYTFFQETSTYEEDQLDTFSQFVQQHLKVVIYIPNTDLVKLREVLSDMRGDDQNSPQPNKAKRREKEVSEIFRFLKIGSENNYLSFLYLMVPSDASSDQPPQLLKVDKELKIVSCDVTTEQLFNDWTNANNETTGFLNYVASLFTLSYLVARDQNADSVQSIDYKYQSTRLKWLEKQNLPPDMCQKSLLDVILSPQQHKILLENDRMVCLPGEPGCGKTSILLAKLMIEARREDTDYVFFVVPQSKKYFLEFVESFVNDHVPISCREKVVLAGLDEQDSNSLEKFILSYCRDVNQLNRSAVLVDEIYLGQEIERPFFINRRTLCNIIFHLKLFWLAYIDIGDVSLFGCPMKKLVVQNFVINNLNILFRNTHHISTFSTKFIHTRKPFSGSSAFVHGCAPSSQLKFSIHEFLESLEIPENLANLDSKYCKDRMTIVYTEDCRIQHWTDLLGQRLSVSGKLFVSNPEKEYFKLAFTGCETQSVVLIVDVDVDSSPVIEPALILALTRAQFELVFLVRSQFKAGLDCFLETKASKYYYEKVNELIANEKKVDLSDATSLEKETGLLEWQIASVLNIEPHDSVLSFLRNFPEDKKGEFALCILNNYVHVRRHADEKRRKVLDVIEEGMAAHIRQSVAEALDHYETSKQGLSLQEIEEKCLIYGTFTILDWLHGLIGDRLSKRWAEKSGKILFTACLNRRRNDVIPWAIDFLKKYDLLKKETATIHQESFDFFDKDGPASATLLLVLCSRNADVECVKDFLQNGFPDCLIAYTLDGKTALFWAISFNNLQVVETLLACEQRRLLLLDPVAVYEKMDATEFASTLGHETIANYIRNLSK